MIFTDLYRSPKSHFSRFRHSHHSLALGDPTFDADLVSKDKTKQKEAVKRHLQAKVRNDWVFTWPIEAPEPTSQPAVTTDAQNDATAPPAVNGEIEGFLEVAAENADETALDSGDEADSSDSDADADSIYSTVTEDTQNWRPRLEWASELSEDELPYNSPSPFKYDNPDSIGVAVTASKIARKTRRRRELRKEMAWNDGLACFEARRNAWTGAKVVRIRPKPPSPASPASPKKGLFWRTQTHPTPSSNSNQLATSPTLTAPLTLVATSPSPDALTNNNDAVDTDKSTNKSISPKTSHGEDSRQKLSQTAELLPVETLLPIPAPLLPPANLMRASINPALYNSIYEKVVVHSLQPSCPINLGDMLRACVAGWKRDGEWPPRSSVMVPEPPAVVAVKRHKHSTPSNASSAGYTPPGGRKMSFSFLVGRNSQGQGQQEGGERTRRESSAAGGEEGSGGSNTGKTIRRSLQKVLGIGGGHSPTMASVTDGHAVLQQH